MRRRTRTLCVPEGRNASRRHPRTEGRSSLAASRRRWMSGEEMDAYEVELLNCSCEAQRAAAVARVGDAG